MAVSLLTNGIADLGNEATSFTTASVSPASGGLLVLFAHALSDIGTPGANPTAAGLSGTWTRRDQEQPPTTGGIDSSCAIFTCADYTGSGTITVTWPGGSGSVTIGAHSLFLVTDDETLDTTVSVNGTGNTATTTIGGSPTTVLCAGFSFTNGKTWTPASGYTESVDQQVGSSATHTANFDTSSPGSTIGGTLSAPGGGADRWIVLGIGLTSGGISGSLAETQDAQTLTASGHVEHSGSLSETQADQTLEAAGTVVPAVIPKTSAVDAVDKSTYTTASITIGGAKKVALVAVLTINGSSPNTPSLSGPSGVDWAVVSDFFFDQVSTFRRLTVFAGTAASETTGAITIDYAAQNQNTVLWSVVEASEIDTTTNKGVVQSATNQASGTALTVTLPSAISDPANLDVGVFANGSNTSFTPGSGFLELHDLNAAPETADGTLQTEWKIAGSDITIEATSAISDPDLAGIGFELAAFTGVTSGSLAETQDDQTLSASGWAEATGSLSETQADQTLSASGHIEHSGLLAETQDTQTLSASGHIEHSGSLAETQDDQTLSASGVTGDATSGSLSEAQDDQTLSASGQLGLSGSLGKTQADQALTADGWAEATGSLSEAQADQTLAATGQLRLEGELVQTQSDQALSASGWAEAVGTLAVTQDDQTLSAVIVVGEFETPAERTLVVAPETRALVATAEDRVLTVEPEARELTVAAEDRVLTVELETRTLVAR